MLSTRAACALLAVLMIGPVRVPLAPGWSVPLPAVLLALVLAGVGTLAYMVIRRYLAQPTGWRYGSTAQRPSRGPA